ncbi:MAG TPA: DUF6526 family protein [Candidatus Kapabacteria bacterium]|nr:DUF6526 family protein [Candidatus Kapabacteria bacterium]
MGNPSEQRYDSHARYVPPFHFLTSGLIGVFVIYSIYRVITVPSLDSAAMVCIGIAAALLFFYTRAFATANQDRIIRMEERYRLARLLPGDLAERIEEFDGAQLIALRFAPDGELPELARRVLNGEVRTGDQIKKMIRTWRPDDMRV